MRPQRFVVTIQLVVKQCTGRDARGSPAEFGYRMGPVVDVKFEVVDGIIMKHFNEVPVDIRQYSNRWFVYLKARKFMKEDARLAREYPRERYAAIGYTKIVRLNEGAHS